MTFMELTHPDDRAATEASLGRLLAGDIPEYTLEKRYRRKDGGEIWSLTTVTLMRDAAGQPLRFIGVIDDITQRKNAEAALHEERRILEILNETGKLLASQLDLQSLAQAVTDAATQLSGAQFGSFFYNVTDETGDAFLPYTLSGAPRDAFASIGNPRSDRALRPDLPRRAAHPVGRRVQRSARRNPGAASRHAEGTPAGTQLSRRARQVTVG